MFKVHVIAGLFLVSVLVSCTSILPRKSETNAKPEVKFTLQKVAFTIGETTIDAQVRQFGQSQLTMVNLHDDEQTSVDAAVAVLGKQGGRLVELAHTGKRRVVFSLDGNRYSFDPNRIFSEAGVRLTVRMENENHGAVPEGAHVVVSRFADQFVRHFRLDKQRALIALHNNGEGGLSIHSYAPGAEYEADTDELFVSSKIDPDDFYFVTDKRFFDELKQKNSNVILQDNSIRRDDGSLSVFAGRRGIPYINVEAQPEHLEEQTKMIEIAVELMR